MVRLKFGGKERHYLHEKEHGTYTKSELYFIFRSKHTTLERLPLKFFIDDFQTSEWLQVPFATLLIVQMTLGIDLSQSFFSKINTNAMRKVYMQAWLLGYTMLYADVIIRSKLRPR